ncbi:MAG: hypothetical protein KJ601_00070 [Nanoarchaeota archaeon]|nr:hypothetical protein [Nanoarchaeota archaeon]MBU1703854.1 hypothetical protein [Nanoarchaeota archaeon]
MKKRERMDLILLLVYPIIGAFVSHVLNVNAFGSIIVFFGLASLYLTIRAFQYSKKALLSSVIISIPLIVIIDYIAQTTKQWVIPNSILPFRLFGIVTIEVIVWVILDLYLVIMFYEYFLDKRVTKKLWHLHMKYFVIITWSLFALFVTLYLYLPTFLDIPFFYICFGIVLLLIPSIIQMVKHTKTNVKFFKTAAYFFYLKVLYEVTALQLGWWDFPGTDYIGWVSILNIKFPIEELIFWLFIFTIAILTYYRYFEDDGI